MSTLRHGGVEQNSELELQARVEMNAAFCNHKLRSMKILPLLIFIFFTRHTVSHRSFSWSKLISQISKL